LARRALAALIFSVAVRFPAAAVPVTSSDPSVPTLVRLEERTPEPKDVALSTGVLFMSRDPVLLIFPVTSKGWRGVAVTIPTRFAVELTIRVLESMVTFPVTFSADKVPTLVIPVCAGVRTLPKRLVPVIDVPLTFPVVTLPETFRDVNVPSSVMAEAFEDSVPVTVRFPTTTFVDRIVVVAWRTLMMAFADHASVVAVLMVLAVNLLPAVLNRRSH
jgi:hypothetical protein